MTIASHPLAQNEIADQVFNLLLDAEDLRPAAYFDGLRLLTKGIGFNLEIQVDVGTMSPVPGSWREH